MTNDFQQVIDLDFNLDAIVQGNNGSVMRFTVRRKKAVVNIYGATVNVSVKRGNEMFTKNAAIVDAAQGVCEITLTRGELTTSGIYYLQPTIIFPDDDEFSGDIHRFTVIGKLTGTPSEPGQGGSNPVFTVRDSAVNGNIIVNGAEMVVYDDSELSEIVENKSDKNHTHSISEIIDIDATDKTNGYALIYDSVIDKFKSQSLPNMVASLDGLTDVDLSSFIPVEGNVLQFQNGIWKPGTASTSIQPGKTLTYIIELSRWGIKNDGTDKINTTKGINDAYLWAKTNGYNHIYLPEGDYLVAFNYLGPSIKMLDNTHFELDKNAKIQLETNSSTGYQIFGFKNVKNVKLTGGKIIGDRQSHIFNLSTTFVRGGVNADGSLNSNSNFIRSMPIDRNNPLNGLISNGFRMWKPTGGSVGLTSTGYHFYQYKDTISTSGFINSRTDGIFAPSSSTNRGWFADAKQMIFVIDITATPMTDQDISNLTAVIDNSGFTHEWGYGVSIEASTNIEVSNMEISECTGDGVYTGWIYNIDPLAYTQEGNIGSNIFIHDCEIHHNRRQGISLTGPNDVYVYNNNIHHIGYNGDTLSTDPKYFTAPAFGIDIESMVGESNMPHKDESQSRGITTGLEVNYRLHIFNNYVHHNNRGHFVNSDGTYVNVVGNTFEGLNVGGVTTYQYPFVRFVNNTFKDSGDFQIQGDAYVDGAIMYNSSIKIGDVRGAVINNVKIKNGNFSGASTYGYFGYPSVDVPTSTFTYTSNHGMGNTAQIVVEQFVGKLPTGLSPDKVYYTTNITAKSFQLSEINTLTTSKWASKAYALNDIVLPNISNGFYYVCTTAGISDVTEPNWPTTVGNTVTNGSVVWTTKSIAVQITDSGTTGFNISRYNYGKLFISNVVIDRDLVNGILPVTSMSIVATGAVLKDITIRNGAFDFAAPKNYVGRQNTIDNLIIQEGTGNLSSWNISNAKFFRTKTMSVVGDVTFGVATNSGNEFIKTVIDNCYFYNTSVDLGNCLVLNSTFVKSNILKVNSVSSSSTVMKSYFENNTINLHWVSSFGGYGAVRVFNNVCNNVTLDLGNGVQMFGNTDFNTGVSLDRSVATPSQGYYDVGRIIYNTVPVTGESIGWICTTAGYANKTSWTASTSKAAGDRINVNGHVYESQNAGRTPKIIPTFLTTSGATIIDNTSIPTWSSKSYILNDVVFPTSPNGLFYECTTAGTSSGTEPIWSTTIGSYVQDGTVTWQVRQIINWKEIGVLATFKEFGLISG